MLLPPLNLSMDEVSRREGVSEMSLSNWRKQLSSEGRAVSENKQSAQNWSAETKVAVVLDAAGLSEIDLGEYCRRKGLYPEQITAWRQAIITGQKSQKVQQKEDREHSRKDKKRIQELQWKNSGLQPHSLLRLHPNHLWTRFAIRLWLSATLAIEAPS